MPEEVDQLPPVGTFAVWAKLIGLSCLAGVVVLVALLAVTGRGGPMFGAGVQLSLASLIATPTATPIPTPTPVPAIACERGIQLVQQRHSTMFSLMAHQVTDLRFGCGTPTADGLRPVTVSWYWNGAHKGTYAVTLSGDVEPADATAAKLDEAAKAGPLILKYLSGI